jgi:FkbM family methyltransferase
MYYNIFDKRFFDLLSEVLRPGDAFIDCGANVGYFTFLAASLVKSKGCVLSFEPNPICCDRIETCIDIGGYGNIHLVKGAVSDTNTEMSFNIAEDPMYSSFSDVEQLSFARLDKTISVPVCTIDSAIGTHCSDQRCIRLIKIDVEGAELEALRGMSETLERKAYDYIYVELHPQQLANRNIDINEVHALLEKSGYRNKNWGQPRKILYARE